jgi:alpha-tubulin suppressor-like RCC1 family protein
MRPLYICSILALLSLFFHQQASSNILSSSHDHTLFVIDGGVWAWGKQGNLLGTSKRLEDIDVLMPSPVEGLNDIAKVIAGTFYNFAINKHGQVFVWGVDGGKQGSSDALIPPTALKNLERIDDIIMDDQNYYAIDQNGQVFRIYETKFDGPLITEYEPTPWGTIKNVLCMASSGYRVFAADHDGLLWFWQRDSGSPNPSSFNLVPSPKAIVGYENNFHMLDQDGSVWVSSFSRQAPDRPIRLQHFAVVKKIAAGVNSQYALDEQGNLWAWGQNQYGQLGLGHTRDISTPTKIEAPVEFTAIAAGSFFSVAIDKSGEIWGWGLNTHARLGDLKTSDVVSMPQKLPGFPRIPLTTPTPVKNAKSSAVPRLSAAL